MDRGTKKHVMRTPLVPGVLIHLILVGTGCNRFLDRIAHGAPVSFIANAPVTKPAAHIIPGVTVPACVTATVARAFMG